MHRRVGLCDSVPCLKKILVSLTIMVDKQTLSYSLWIQCFSSLLSSLRSRVIIQTASEQTVPKATGQRKIGGRFSVNDVVMWVRDSSSSGHCTVARAQPDHREGGLRFFPQPSITHTHISKDRYKQTQPDALLCTSPLCFI